MFNFIFFQISVIFFFISFLVRLLCALFFFYYMNKKVQKHIAPCERNGKNMIGKEGEQERTKDAELECVEN